MAESVPVTAEVLARALATLPRPPWYEAEPFKTILAVVIGGFLTLAANWWLKHLELQARADSLKVAFRGEVGALRSSLRVEAKHARTTYEADGLLTGGVTYSRTVFEQNASHIGDLGDPTLVRQLATRGLRTPLRCWCSRARTARTASRRPRVSFLRVRVGGHATRRADREASVCPIPDQGLHGRCRRSAPSCRNH